MRILIPDFSNDSRHRGDGFSVVQKVWVNSGKRWDYTKSGYEVEQTGGGHLVKVCDCNGADAAIEHVFTKLAVK